MAAASGDRFVWEEDLVYVSASYVRQAISYQTLYRVRASHLLALNLDGVEVIQTKEGEGSKGGRGTSWTKAYAPAGAGGGLLAQPGKIFAPARPEGSLYFDGGRKEWLFVDKDLYSHIEVCRTSDIVGPWKCSFVAQLREDPRFFYYAGKAHPDLVSSGGSDASTGLVVSYVSNCLDVALMFENEYRTEYVPKFLLIEGV